MQIDESWQKHAIGLFGDPAKLLQVVKPGEWNDDIVLAEGGHNSLKINRGTMCEVVKDQDPKRPQHGWPALQVHVRPPTKVQFKDIFLRRFSRTPILKRSANSFRHLPNKGRRALFTFRNGL